LPSGQRQGTADKAKRLTQAGFISTPAASNSFVFCNGEHSFLQKSKSKQRSTGEKVLEKPKLKTLGVAVAPQTAKR